MSTPDANLSDRQLSTPVELGLAFLPLLAMPVVISVSLEEAQRSVLQATIPAADILIWIAALAAICGCIVRQGPRRTLEIVRLPTRLSGELVLFVVIAAISVVGNGLASESLKEFVQVVDYFIIWYWLVAAVARDPRFLGWSRLVVPGYLLVLVLLASGQIRNDIPHYLIRSAFRDQQSYLATMVILMPLVWCLLSRVADPWINLFGYALVGYGCATLGSAGAILLVTLQLTWASKMMGGPWLRRVGILLAVTVVCLLVAVPAGYRHALGQQLRNGWFSVDPAERRIEVQQAMRLTRPPATTGHFPLGPYHCFLGTNLQDWNVRPAPRTSLPSANSQQRVPSQYYAENWSALALLRDGPVFGYGLGSWQSRIGTAFGVVERTGTAFPNFLNGYLLLAVTTGVLGLLAWCLANRGAMIRAHHQRRGAANEHQQAAMAGCLAGMMGAAVFLFVCPWVTQPLAVGWVFLAAWVHGSLNNDDGVACECSTCAMD